MPAIELLRLEHETITKVNLATDATVVQLRVGGHIDPSWLIDLAAFHVVHTDGAHHAKEEGVLFKAMVASGVSTRRGPIATLLSEHNVGRELVQHLSRLARACAQLEPEPTQAWSATALSFSRLLTSHINKEERVLFPLAKELLTADQLAQVHTDYQQIPAPAEPLEVAGERLVSRARAWWPKVMAAP